MYITKSDFPIDTEKQSLVIPNSGGARQSVLVPEGDIQAYVFEDAKTLIEVMQRGHKVSKNGPCLGWRDSEPQYKWLSYGEVIKRYENFSRGLVQAGLKEGQESFLGIYAQNCVEWVVTEYACYFLCAVLVPLYDTLGPTACSYILNHVEAEFLICDTEKNVKTILDSKENIPKLRHIIAIQEVSEEIKQLAAQKEVTLHRFKDIEESGKKNSDSFQIASPSDVATVCFTSGTTGDPKGVILTHGNLVACASGIIKHLGVDYIGPGDRLLSYLPMAHMMDRISQVILYSTGGAVGFFRGDIKLLSEDMKFLRPTMMAAVPRVLNKIYDKVQSEVQAKPLKKFLLDMALRAKQADLDRGIIRNNSMWDHFVLKNIRNAFGGKVRLLVAAGAPIRTEVLAFFKCSIGCPVVQAYGQTEATAACNLSVIGDKIGSAGPPLPCAHIKLEDVPDMGYYEKNGEGEEIICESMLEDPAVDVMQGSVRGPCYILRSRCGCHARIGARTLLHFEILIKGPIVSKGYYKDPVKTAEVLDKDGWLHSGDIGKWNENGSLSIIDRKKNLLKLSQGEYVSPEKIEAVYLGCPLLDQIFVHGDSLESCLVAIAVPDKEALMSWCSEQKIKGDWNEICQNEDVRKHILKNLNQLGENAGLKGFEKVKAIHLHPNVFSLEDSFLTVTMKLRRPNLKKHFKDVIQKMYDSLR